MQIEKPVLKHLKIGWLPNMRKLIQPDPGYTIIDMDLDRADLQIVVWDADDTDLKKALKSGIDLHIYNAAQIFKLTEIPEYEMFATHPKYDSWKNKYKKERDKTKNGVHGTNYGASSARLAVTLGIPIEAAREFQKIWFELHPKIEMNKNRIKRQLAQTNTVTNIFGYSRQYFDRPDTLLPQALAWIPQSTVAIIIDIAMDNICTHLSKDVDILFQVHDSLVMQCRTEILDEIIPQIEKHSLITVPYPDPLIIPVGFETSTISWGDCAPYRKHKKEENCAATLSS
jgi:DNA polymerase I-like protein with 3'-5' exonuclease and polymerase domains